MDSDNMDVDHGNPFQQGPPPAQQAMQLPQPIPQSYNAVPMRQMQSLPSQLPFNQGFQCPPQSYNAMHMQQLQSLSSQLPVNHGLQCPPQNYNAMPMQQMQSLPSHPPQGFQFPARGYNAMPMQQMQHPVAYAPPFYQQAPPSLFSHAGPRAAYSLFGHSADPSRFGTPHTPSSKYDDDEDFNSLIPISSDQPAQDITLTAKCAYKGIPAGTREVPCMLSLAASGHGSEVKQGMDLVCVIDISGSMCGPKIELVRQTLEFMVTLLSDHDRVSLVLFDDRAYRICPLTTMNAAGADRITQLIRQIDTSIPNEIREGWAAGLAVIDQRRKVNTSTAMLLLSDGVDSICPPIIAELSSATQGRFAIHTFGYGTDHDSGILMSISDRNEGNFYYVEDVNSIAEAFANCISEIGNVAVGKPQVRITTLSCDIPFALTKVYSESGDSQFSMPSVISNSHKEAVFVLQLQADLVSDVISPVQISVVYTELTTGQSKELETVLELHKAAENGEVELDKDVMVNFYRVKGAEILKEVTGLADAGQFNQAKQLALRGAEELKQCVVAEVGLVRTLVNDLTEASNRVNNMGQWAQGGRAQVASLGKNHFQQQAAVNSACYQAPSQVASSGLASAFMAQRKR